MCEPRTSPASRTVARAQVVNARLGHENLGSLSAARGFVPLRAPRLSLPGSHTAWDDVAAQLPALYREMTLRPVVEHMPVLPADRAALPDWALHRAATVLGILGHAYVHVSAPEPADVPASIAEPWAEVRQRLGRAPEPVLAYTDLILNNWRVDGEGDQVPLRVSNLRLLVPTVDNQEERVFYLAQLEILAGCAPIVPAVAGAQDAILNDDRDGLRNALDAVTAVLRTVSRSSLGLIDPRPRSVTHVDPVVWAKTVAPLAVPFRTGVLGPSGTASPIFNLLDVFLGRRSHASQLGSEIACHRRSYPVHWRALLDAVERVPVADYVASHPRADLMDALESAREAYAGPEGFLGRHRRKAYGYLAVAFKVGRGLTIGGFSGPPQARTWNKVDTELTESRAERLLPGSTPSGRRQRPAQADPRRHDVAAGPGRGVTASELARHNDTINGWWVSIDGRVHDVTDFVERHPGGAVVLRAHAGLDATNAFHRAHAAEQAGVNRLLETTDIGFLSDPELTAARRVYRSWIDALFTVVELQNTFRLDRSFSEGTDLCVSSGRPPSAFQTDRAVDTYLRFANEYLPELIEEVLRPLAERVATADVGQSPGDVRARSVQAAGERRQPVRGAVGGPRAASGPLSSPGRLRDGLDRVDRTIEVVKSMLCAGSRSFEKGGDGELGGRELRRLADRSIAVIVSRRPVLDLAVLPGPGESAHPQERMPPVSRPAATVTRLVHLDDRAGAGARSPCTADSPRVGRC
jgi:cytochrome b involved in lipid metabolism